MVAHFARSSSVLCHRHGAIPSFALVPYVGNPFAPLPLWLLELDYCVWAVSTSQLKESERGGGEEISGIGRGRECWHFQIISVEPFWGFNVIFGLWIFALFAIEQKVLQSKRGGKEGGNKARDRHGRERLGG